MRIGILTNYCLHQFGGAEEALDRLASHWHQAGHDVVLFCPWQSENAPRAWQPRYRAVRIPKPFSTRFGLFWFERYLRREHRRQPFDVLIGSDAYWPGHVTWRFERRTRVPYVLYSHGSDINDRSRFLSRLVCRERIQTALESAAGIACISRYMESRVRHLAGPRGIVRVIPNGWPDEWTAATSAPALIRDPYLFAMGRIIELKGFQTLLAAYHQLRAQRPNLKLVIAGDGPYRQSLAAQATELGLRVHGESVVPAESVTTGERDWHVWLPGFVTGEVKQSLARHAWVGVCPSIFEEALGIVILEMLSLGTPVIGSAVGGITDLVQPGVNGALFTPRDAAQLAQRIDRIPCDGTSYESLRSRAADSVAHLRWSEIAKRHLELIRESIAAHAAQLTADKSPVRRNSRPAEVLSNEHDATSQQGIRAA